MMQSFPKPWFIAAGWAIDLFLGSLTRQHSDIDIGIFRCDQHLLRNYLPEWRFTKAVNFELIPWLTHESLELPIHEVHAQNTKDKSQILEILLQEKVGNEWAFRRDQSIRLNAAKAIHTSQNGIPFLAPEIVLLYKSKYLRPKDGADFAAVYPKLDNEQKQWFQAALRESDPEHEWLKNLDG